MRIRWFESISTDSLQKLPVARLRLIDTIALAPYTGYRRDETLKGGTLRKGTLEIWR